MQRFILAGVCSLIGCGAPADPVKGYTSIWEANCDAVARCSGQAPEEDWDWADERLSACSSAMATDENWSIMFREAVELGRVVYDRDSAKQCIKENKTVSCSDFWNTTEVVGCGDVFVGQLNCAEECSIHQECASGVCRGNLCDCSI